MLFGFLLELRSAGIKIGMGQILDFFEGVRKGLVFDIDSLYIYSRLCFVKRPTKMDLFDRIFGSYFYDLHLPFVTKEDSSGFDLLRTKEFAEWLQNAYENGELEKHPHLMSGRELMEKFWKTVEEQLEEHHGGGKWVGTGGTSPFGHSGFAEGGVNVFGPKKNFSAIKSIGRRNYISYSGKRTVKKDNISEAISALKNLKPTGPEVHLDIDETIYRTARNGGDIELVFKREMRDKLDIILLVDNGGRSMLPYVKITNEIFAKMRSHFHRFSEYYFHNTIYGYVYRDEQRERPYSIAKILQKNPETRIIFLGDASMAPAELLGSYGNINYGEEEPTPSIEWLQKIRKRFSHCVWLNPIREEEWESTSKSMTLDAIRDLFPMVDLTIDGLKKAVEILND